jgi:hypothetical protein
MSAEDRPDYDVNVCLDEISEGAKRDLTLVDKNTEQCTSFNCTTFKSIHRLKVAITRVNCDSILGKVFSGSLVAERLVLG